MRTIIERHPRPPTPEATETWCRTVWVAGFLLLLNADQNSTREMISRGEQALVDPSPALGATVPTGQRASRAELAAAFLQLRGLVALMAQDAASSARYPQSALKRVGALACGRHWRRRSGTTRPSATGARALLGEGLGPQ